MTNALPHAGYPTSLVALKERILHARMSAARTYYLRATAKLGWSRSVLLKQIKAGAGAAS